MFSQTTPASKYIDKVGETMVTEHISHRVPLQFRNALLKFKARQIDYTAKYAIALPFLSQQGRPEPIKDG